MNAANSHPAWPVEGIGRRRAVALTLAFWAFTFVVFQAPALRTGALTLWETAGYLVIVALGALMSLGVLWFMHATRRLGLRTRIVLIALVCMVAAMAHSYADHEIFVIFDRLFEAHAPLRSRLDGFLFNILIYVWIYGLYATAIGLILTSRAMRDQERRLARATAAAQEAQLAALRFQINPHFLFNALNAVTALIGSGRYVEAETVVVRLSEFFRVSLATSPSDLVPLEDELDVVGSYLDIEAARFAERLVVDIDLPEALRHALTPHFILQPLVENAVKHGVARSKTPVTISISVAGKGERLAILVADDAGAAPAGAPAANGAGVGLANVRARLSALYGEAGTLTTVFRDGCFRAEIGLPLQFTAALDDQAAA